MYFAKETSYGFQRFFMSKIQDIVDSFYGISEIPTFYLIPDFSLSIMLRLPRESGVSGNPIE